jgi:hypothetical protein
MSKRIILATLALTFCFAVPAEARVLKNAVIQSPAKGSPEWIVLKTLEAGMDNDFEGWYDAYCHSDYCLGTTRNKNNFVKYTWKRFLKWVDSYFVDKTQRSFKVVRTSPDDFDDTTREIKLFIHSSKRDMPVPIIIRKDKDGTNKVFNSSL